MRYWYVRCCDHWCYRDCHALPLVYHGCCYASLGYDLARVVVMVGVKVQHDQSQGGTYMNAAMAESHLSDLRAYIVGQAALIRELRANLTTQQNTVKILEMRLDELAMEHGEGTGTA